MLLRYALCQWARNDGNRLLRLPGCRVVGRRLAADTGLQIDSSLAKLCAVFVQLWHEAKTHIRSLGTDAGGQVWSEILCKTLAGSQRKCSDQLFEVRHLFRAQDGLRVRHKLADFFARESEPGGTLYLSRLGEVISLAEGEFRHVIELPSINPVTPLLTCSTRAVSKT